MDLELTFHILMANLDRAITGGIIVACLIIFFTGGLKMKWLGKIKNKLLRKAVLWLMSLVLTFPGTAIYFLLDNISFRWYWYACALMCFLTTFMYVFYENTGLRNFIHWVARRTLSKFANVLITLPAAADGLNDTKIEDAKNKLTKTTEELKEEIKAEMQKQYKEDPDLKNV
jgi:hypothetical protein